MLNLIHIQPGVLAMVASDTRCSAGPSCTFVSQGLADAGQREVEIEILLRAGETADTLAPAVAELFSLVHQMATESRLVDIGDVTTMGGSGFLEPHILGLAYGESESGNLRAVTVRKDELPLLKVGAHRVLSRLGRETSHFPFPTWSDRDRESVWRGDEELESLFVNAAPRRFHGLSVYASDHCVHIEGLGTARLEFVELARALGSDSMLAIRPDPLCGAQGRLAWFPGDDEPTAITPPTITEAPLRITGAGLLLGHGAEASCVGLHEDGFMVALTTEHFTKLLDSASHATELKLSTEDYELRVSWVSDAVTSLAQRHGAVVTPGGEPSVFEAFMGLALGGAIAGWLMGALPWQLILVALVAMVIVIQLREPLDRWREARRERARRRRREESLRKGDP